MVLVPSDDRPRVPRVGPKVFADVPSQHEVTKLKKSRGQVFVFAILVIGVLIAALVVIGYLFMTNRTLEETNAAQVEQLAELTNENGKLNREMDEYGDYRSLTDLRGQADQLREQIRVETVRYPTYPPPNSGPITRIGQSDNGFRSPRSWDQSNSDALSKLNAEIAQLRRDLDAAEGWRPPRPTPTPGEVRSTPRTIDD